VEGRRGHGAWPIVGPIVLVVIVLAGVATMVALDKHRSAGTKQQPVITTTMAQPPATVLQPDQAVISGLVTSAHLVDAVGAPLAMPVTITVPARGKGRLTIDGVEVGGRPAAIGWDGGQPLPLAGNGDLDLGPVTMDVGGSTITWYLDGMSRYLRPGLYRAESDVAVGDSGLATPESQAVFSVAPGTIGELASAGNARVILGPRPLSLTGPATATLSGTFTVETASGTKAAHTIEFGPGPFELTLTPTAGGYHLSGLLQGPITSS